MPFSRSHTLPLFFLLFGSFGSAILGDSTAEALLLARLGSKYVPGLFLINAAFLFLLSSMIMSVIDRWDRGNLFLAFIGTHTVVLLCIRLLINFDLPLLFLFLFSYAYVTKILIFLLFWTLTNDLIDSRRAGSDFPIIAAGGTLGAILFSFAIPNMLKFISAENLLFVWAGAMIVTGGIFVSLKLSFASAFKPVGDRYLQLSFRWKTLRDDLNLVRTDPLLRTMAIFYFLLFFIVLNQHYSFYDQLNAYFSGTEDQASQLAGFLGYFNGVSMFSTFLLQVSIAGIVIRKAGSTRSMFILPAAFCVVFSALLVMGIIADDLEPKAAAALLFWGVVIGVGTRIAFFDSFFSPNFQIFFSSLPQNVRGRGKLSIEGVVKPAAMITAGVWLFLVAPRIPFLMQISLLLFLSVIMVLQTRRLKQKYTASLAQYLRGFKSKNTQLIRAINVSSKETLFLDLVENVLKKEEPNVKAYVIDMLATMNSTESISILIDYIPRADSKTRATIISALSGIRHPQAKDVFLRFLDDSDKRVVANCIDALSRYRSQEVFEKVERFLKDENPRIRANAVAALWNSATSERKEELALVLRHMMDMGYPLYSASALYAMGQIRFPNLVEELGSYYADHPDWVGGDKTVWRQYVLALSSTGQRESVDVLLKISDVAGRKQRNQISTAIGLLMNRGVSTGYLISRLPGINYMQRGVLLKALHVRAFERGRDSLRVLQDIAGKEIRSIYSHWVAFDAVAREKPNPGLVLLQNSIMEECINESLRNLFYVASMLDGSGQIRRIVHRLFHTNERVRAQALEVLDNAGDFRTNRSIVKLLETSDPAIHTTDARTLYKMKPRNYLSVVNEYAHCPNTWVRECCSYAMSCHFTESGEVPHEQALPQAKVRFLPHVEGSEKQK